MKLLKWILLALVLAFVYSGFFVVSETEQVVVTQLGNPVGDPITEAGLHFKIPVIQTAHYFEKRILEWDGNPKQIPTADKKYILVDTFARWKIVDPLKFYQTVQIEAFAHSRLDDIIDGRTRDIVSLHALDDVVRNSNRKLKLADEELGDGGFAASENIGTGREKIQDSIFQSAKTATLEYGIELIDVKIKRVNYIDEVRRKVYERMKSERNKIAAKFISEGQGKAAEILGEMKKELDTIESEAYKTAEDIMGKADAEATKIYAEAYSRDASFYEFTKTLETYKKTTTKQNSLIMTTDSDFYKYFKNSSGK